jgi:predicted alpha/beta superfamily hydrolase
MLSIPGLNRTRGLRIYTPPGYADSTKRYPVVYMHDAQNLFDEYTSQAGEVNVDEIMDELARSGQLEAIVVGIDRSGEPDHLWEHPGRMTELNPFDSQFGRAEGAEFTAFIVNVVKPLIDRQYRTLPDRDNTAMMGGSLGGLITHYAINQYPEVFSKAGIYSPSYWITGNAGARFFTARPPRSDARMYFLVGGNETGTMVVDTQDTYNAVVASGHPAANVTLRIAPNGEHGEALYRAEIKAGMLWLFNKTP